MPCAFSSADELPEIFFAVPISGLSCVVVDDVVAVLAAGARLQDGRRITMRDAQLREIRHQLARVFEAKAMVELQAIGRERVSSCASHAPELLEAGAEFRGLRRSAELNWLCMRLPWSAEFRAVARMQMHEMRSCRILDAALIDTPLDRSALAAALLNRRRRRK